MFKKLFIILTVTIFCLGVSAIAPRPAQALIQIKITDIGYKDCPEGVGEGSVTSGGSALPATCYLVTGKTNNTSGKMLYDADVFGRIYDANNEPALQNRTRLGALPEVPPGVSDFELRISVPSNQPTPLKLKQFKATGFSSSVYPSF
ncbi:hypothetical protein A5482_009125 [Cyanobacterium sp. IPPAS B-1200]|uniref:hypothetical protein n=1 Tax=Cyanobacterium sp. IPPAS B-1200 TaxID=1562720 RepID=UPI00085277C8|nr:hypothetical protein [Cyanobacterium sp. IPPAS B-1200]OEJ77458.1 hypothetical protein A5482_06050 [Cyanobacterium sp. IPPAS B-1200]